MEINSNNCNDRRRYHDSLSDLLVEVVFSRKSDSACVKVLIVMTNEYII